jgi:hypothetical protein
VPDMEDPWLILAAVAMPKASIAYLERALAINPHSERARKGLQWAGRKLKEQPQPVRVREKARYSQVDVPAGPKPVVQREMPSVHAPVRVGSTSRFSYRILIISLLIFLSAAWVYKPAINISSSHAGPDNPILSWLQVYLVKSTYTPSRTATITPRQLSLLLPARPALPP